MGKGGKSQEEANNGEENMAAWLMGINNLKIQPFKLPPLGPHDVKVRMKAVGICGSDVHYLKTLRCADFVVKEPMVIGHECAGIIEEVGSEVKNLVPGDRVALEPGISCWRCDLCKGGRYNLCPEMKFFATPPVHGSLANQVVHPADLCFKLPDNVSLEEGAMCEPLSVGVHACRRAEIGPETNVLVMGAGPIGLVTMLAARAFGAPRIVIVDVDDNRLSVAKDLGADGVVKVSTNTQDVPEEVERICEVMGAAVDVSFDCAGFNKTMSTALSATRAGGKVCLVGMGHSEMTVPLTPAAAREVDVVGIFRYKNTWPLCLEFLRSGKIDVKPLITHRFGFSQKEVEEAFETSARGGNAIKESFMEKENDHEKAMEKIKEMISSLPIETGWRDNKHLCLYQGFWCFPTMLEGVMLAQELFNPKPGDIFVCSFPKSGTTWLKALTFAIINRRGHDSSSNNPLLFKNPHECVFGLWVEHFDKIHQSGRVPLISTHAPYHSLPKSVLSLGSDHCKIVYICRDAKDTFVSTFFFVEKRRIKKDEAISLEQGFELFCQGKSWFGPIWDHILGYWKASLEQPNKVMFLKYEDIKKDSYFHVKKLAEFMGYSFSPQEEQAGIVQKIIDMCSFENLSGLEVNKIGKVVNPVNGYQVSSQDFFRKGKVGDWTNYLTPEMAERLDRIMEQKFRGSGLTFSTS